MARLPGKTFAEQLKAFEAKANEAARAVVAETVGDLGDVAQSHVPVRSGKLKRSLSAQSGLEGEAVRGQLAHRAIKPKIKLGDTVRLRWGRFYAPFVEKGTKHSRAKPFVQPAVDQFQGIVAKAVERVRRAQNFGRGRQRRR